MALTVYDYANKTPVRGTQSLTGLSQPIKSFIDALIAEEEWCSDYFNHGDNRDPNTNGGKCPTGIWVKIYYAPCTNGEYRKYEVLSIKNDTIWASGKRRIALRKDGNDVHKVYLANHTGASTAGVRDNSTYRYTEVDLSK